MSYGQLRKEVESLFGELLRTHGLVETDYLFNERVFGNEVLEFSNSEFGLRFDRDRSQIFIQFRSGKGERYIGDLMSKIGLETDRTFRDGFSLLEVDALKQDFPRIIAALRSP